LAEVMQLGMGQAQPMQMPPPEMIEEARLIAEAVTWEEVEPILRTDQRRNYCVNIETDSTIFEDAEAEKAQRIEVMGAMTTWMERALPAIQTNRSLAPLMKELTMFTLGAFKIGRTLEETFEDAFDQIQDAPEQPNPEQMKLEMEAKAKEAEFAAKAKDREAEFGFKQQEHGLKQQEMQAQLQFKQQELAFKQQELGIKQQEAEFNRQLTIEKSQFEREAAQREMEFKGQEMAVRAEESNFKRFDMDERRKADIQDKEMRRELESGVITERSGKLAEQMDAVALERTGSDVRNTVSQQLQQLAAQFAQSMNELSQNQVQIVQALTDIKGNQDDVTEAVTAVVSHMTAPRKVKRDEKGRAIGVEVGQASGGDIRQMLASLTSGGRQLARDEMGRVASF
jgi:hypothetical protein